jgi:hypothetical protein
MHVIKVTILGAGMGVRNACALYDFVSVPVQHFVAHVSNETRFAEGRNNLSPKQIA